MGRKILPLQLPHDEKCEALTSIGSQCVANATSRFKHNDGREYFVCKRHLKYRRNFSPILGGGHPSKEKTLRTVGYLRVSTIDQNTAKNQADVLKFANDRHFGHVEFLEEIASGKKSWKERKLGILVNELQEGDNLIVPELTRLGRSTLEVLEVLAVTKNKGIAVYSVKEGLELNGDSMQSKVMSTMLALFAELEREFISLRTKEALKALKAAGVKLGRKPGPGKSKLDPHREDIILDMERGVPKTRIAKRYGSTPENLHNWIQKNKIKVESK